jgi:hypothetical protein
LIFSKLYRGEWEKMRRNEAGLLKQGLKRQGWGELKDGEGGLNG